MSTSTVEIATPATEPRAVQELVAAADAVHEAAQVSLMVVSVLVLLKTRHNL